MVTIAVLWQMMYRIKEWFIHLLILSTVYEHDNRKQLYTNQTDSRWKKVNKMRNFTVKADLNLDQKKSRVVTYLFSAYLNPVYVNFIIVKNIGFLMGFVILAIYFQLKLPFLM